MVELDVTPEALPRRRRPRPRRSRPRARTLRKHEMTRVALRRGYLASPMSAAEVLEATAERPRTRSDCAGVARPCPWVGCKHHLFLDINPETGAIKLNFPDLESWELETSCSLDVAERAGVTLEEIGQIMNITRERVRQIEVRGLLNLKRSGAAEDLKG
jgi:hypothetical protein